MEREITDTERLDWLAKRGTFEVETYLGSEWVEIDGEWEGYDLRSAIDTAMLATLEATE